MTTDQPFPTGYEPALRGPDIETLTGQEPGLGSTSEREHVIASLSHADESVRYRAVKRLQELDPNPYAFEPLFFRLRDGSTREKMIATKEMKRLAEAFPKMHAAVSMALATVIIVESDPGPRINAIAFLEDIGVSDDAIAMLRRALEERDMPPEDRRWTPPVEMGSMYWWYITRAVGVLAGFDDPEPFIRQLASPSSADRWAAIGALMRIADEQSINAIIHVLQHDPSKQIRQIASRALERVGDPRVLPYLCQALLADPSSDVRWGAAQSLGLMGRVKLYNMPVKDNLQIDTLIEAMEAESTQKVRGAIAQALGRLEAKEAVPVLAAALDNEPGKSEAQMIRTALKRIGSPAALEVLLNHVEL